MKGIRRWLGAMGVLVLLLAAPLAGAAPRVAGGLAAPWFSGFWGQMWQWVMGEWGKDGPALGSSGRFDGGLDQDGPKFEPGWNKEGPILDPNGLPLNGATHQTPERDPTG